MAHQVHNPHSQHRIVSLQSSIYLLLVLTSLHVCYSRSLFQVEAQKTASFLASSSGASSSSKTNEITSKFRENISQIQRKQVQQQTQQVRSRINQAQEQQVIEQQNQLQVQLQQPGRQSGPTRVVEQAHDDVPQQTSQSEALYGSIRGSPGIDFPDYARIPNTKFSCDDAPFNPGMYADESTGCQVYHLCFQGRRESFLCGVGTVFNQAIMNCDFWHSVDCSRSPEYYRLNVEFGKSSSEPATTSKKSFSQQRIISQVDEQLPPPPIISTFQQQVSKRQQSLIGVPRPQVQQQQSFVRVEENTNLSGKMSPLKQQLSVSNFVSSQVQAGGTKTLQPTVASSLGQYKQFSSQRSGANANFVSPGRRVAQLNNQRLQQQQHQFASAESSPAKSVSTDNPPGQMESPQQVGSSLIVSANSLSRSFKGSGSKTSNTKQTSNFLSQKGSAPVPEGESTLATSRKKADQTLGKQAAVASLQPSGVGVETTTSPNSENEVWKPYFKSKSKTKGEGPTSSSVLSSSKYPQLVGSKSTTRPPAPAEESPSEESSPAPPQLPPTVVLPDKEPTFSSKGSSSSPSEPPPAADTSEEVPKVPDTSPAPEQPSTEGATSEQTTTSSAIEPNAGPAQIVTPPAETAAVKSSPDDAAPPTANTTSEPLPAASRSGAPPTTTTFTTQTPETSTPTASQEEPKPEDVTTTTTTTTATPTAIASSTTAAPEDTPSAGPSADTTTTPTTLGPEGELDQTEADKQKRGVLEGGVEYAHDSQPSRRKTARAKWSSVEYANVPKAPE